MYVSFIGVIQCSCCRKWLFSLNHKCNSTEQQIKSECNMYIDIMGFTFSFYLGLSVFNLLYVVLIIIVIIMTIIIMFCLLRCQGRLTVCLAFVMPDASRQQRKTENGCCLFHSPESSWSEKRKSAQLHLVTCQRSTVCSHLWCMQTVNDECRKCCSTAHTRGQFLPGNI